MKSRLMETQLRKQYLRCSTSHSFLGDQTAIKPLQRALPMSLHQFARLCQKVASASEYSAIFSAKSVIFRAQKDRAKAKMFSSDKSSDTSGEASWKARTSARCCSLTLPTISRMAKDSSREILPSLQATRMANMSSSASLCSLVIGCTMILQKPMWFPWKSSCSTPPRTQTMRSRMSVVLMLYSPSSFRVLPHLPVSKVSHQAPAASSCALLKLFARLKIWVSIWNRFTERARPQRYSRDSLQILMTACVIARESS
mmetsp:Transcript_4170/g.12190  ORF Transcript_4170/g.12190 Transcript_4170/m.12190 type:complete len:256 (-) Transcript_4170:1209-1976(-)